MAIKQVLELNRCPHCNIANPNIYLVHGCETNNAKGGNQRMWGIYCCKSCGGLVILSTRKNTDCILEIFPKSKTIDECIPERARVYLNQALETIMSPAGSIMLSASSIDAMLKDKGFKNGSLYDRIEEAVKNHLITEGMALWAHQIRLEANDQRHADENVDLPTQTDAERIIEFTMALAEFLYVLPHKVDKGIKSTEPV